MINDIKKPWTFNDYIICIGEVKNGIHALVPVSPDGWFVYGTPENVVMVKAYLRHKGYKEGDEISHEDKSTILGMISL